ncbi:MAG: glycosyltransferase family 39 protein [Afipia sp.]|nr:glycosyltransferase family 39 protein [Afipia sp.]OJW61486.1 MAG: hypothetical protein BGO65_10795 [Afipia sp. 64-13]
MAAPSVEASHPSSWRRPFEAWFDGIEAGWAIPVLLTGFVAIWTAFFGIAYVNASLHPDVLEAWSLGRDFAWGNSKHPPLMGWIAGLWSSVFPVADWSMHLLAMTNAALALFAVDLIARRFVRGDRRVVVLLLLMLLPAYQFHAQRFNANSVLLAIWPLATYCFLRSFESRAALWSLAAGAMCALAMLGKYYSLFLIAGFGIAALAHPARMSYLRSSAPWLSMAAGLAVLAPHLVWLWTSGGESLGYGMHVHGGAPFVAVVQFVSKFLLGIAGYLLIPAAVWCVVMRATPRALWRASGAMEPGLLLLALVFVGSVIVPAATALALGTSLPAMWHLQGLFPAVVVAVCAARVSLQRRDAVNFAAVMAVLSLGALLAAPLHALYRNTNAFKENRNFARPAALALTAAWREAYGVPLERVSGDDVLAFATAFYSPDHPFYSRPFRFQYSWGLPREQTLRQGWSALCFADDPTCMNWMAKVEARAHDFRRLTLPIATSLWGRPGVSTTVVALMVPPQGAVPPSQESPTPESLDDVGARRRLPDRDWDSP